MPQVSSQAIILQTFPYSETSKIIRLLTRTHGVQSVIAKGALRPKSRFGGVLEAFTDGVASFYLKESRDLHTLSGFELGRSRQLLASDLVRFGGASLIAEIVLRVVSEESDPDLFDAIQAALDRIETAPVELVESTVLAESWSIVSALGFAPALDTCLGCGRPLADDEDTRFDYTAGGVRCSVCAPGFGGRLLPAAARRALFQLASGAAIPLPRTGAHWRVLARFLSHHVLEGSTLRSLDFLAETVTED